MQTELSYFLIGIGVAILIFILEKTVKRIPRWSIIFGYDIAASLIGLGVLSLFHELKSLIIVALCLVILLISLMFYYWRGLMKLRFRYPVTLKKEKEQSPKNPRPSPMTPKEIADRSAFARALKAVVERLRLNATSAYVNSASHIFQDLHGQSKADIDKHILANQVQRLLDKEFMSFQSGAFELEVRVNKLTSTVPSDGNIVSFCTDITRLVQEYRQLVKELMTFLDGLQQEGVKAIWDSDPWSAKIHTELANDYDRLMALVRDLRRDTPEGLRSTLPSELDGRLDNFSKLF